MCPLILYVILLLNLGELDNVVKNHQTELQRIEGEMKECNKLIVGLKEKCRCLETDKNSLKDEVCLI